jgi:hypothetical protein
MRLSFEPWLDLLPADPRPWILESGEPEARFVALAELCGDRGEGAEARRARKAVHADSASRELVARLPDWERETRVSGHNSPGFAPNLLMLLADRGAGPGDHPEIERILDQMLRHQDAEGRFQSFGRWPGQDVPVWGALLCDTHAIVEVLVRFGRGGDGRVARALACMAGDLAATAQGRGWPCVADPVSGFRGPGRTGDICPQVTLEALRTFARLPASKRPRGLLDAARSLTGVWLARGRDKPYLFGHGRQFKAVKWPAFWYGVLGVLDALSRYPRLWSGPAAKDEDRRAVAEMMACLAAYNVGPDGLVTPRSCYKGFESMSFGQKKLPSAFATALVCAVLRRLSPLAPQARAVDVSLLGSSKGGSGRPMPPRATARARS